MIGAPAGRDRGYARVALGTPDIVDDRGARSERRFGHLGLVAVDRDRRVDPRFQPGDDRQHARHLGRGIDGAMAGTGRFAADIDDGCSFACEARAMGDRRFGVLKQPAIREGIGRDVDDAHDERRRGKREAAAVGQGEGRGHAVPLMIGQGRYTQAV
jgi:hypothetical protein